MFWTRACGLFMSPLRCDVTRTVAKCVPGSA